METELGQLGDLDLPWRNDRPSRRYLGVPLLVGLVWFWISGRDILSPEESEAFVKFMNGN